ncbi:MAG: hypothetical protein RL154_974 [Pseudomonadota bacterium]|jgi:type IV/VI secretion system ImpK/VasF family protein
MAVSITESFISFFSYAIKLEQIISKNNLLIEPKVIFDDLENMLTDTLGLYEDKKRANYALFAVCVFIDEKFLALDNSEFVELWKKNTLQKKFFKTTNGGVIFYNKLNEIRNDAELLEFYEYALALGFRGEYYSEFDTEKINVIKQKNTANINLKTPYYIFENAYSAAPLAEKERLSIISFAQILTFIIPFIITCFIYFTLDYKLSSYCESILSAVK